MALLVAYDGGPFRGFAPNPGVPTVAGALLRAAATVFQFEPSLTCAGRTDAGVHARGQVVTIDVPDRPALNHLPRLRRSLDRLAGEAISVVDVAVVDDTFDARGSARARTYRYLVENRRAPDPVLRSMVWWVPYPLDVEAMDDAAQLFVGTHDFSSFCRRKEFSFADGTSAEATRVRTVQRAGWNRAAGDRDLVEFWVTATSFCQQMVRSMVGTLVDVGLARRTATELPAMLAATDRNAAGRVAPPQGLSLWNVAYDSSPFRPDDEKQP